ncbi:MULTISPECIES: DUF2061 domain-containing protein [Flammeovirga]|uniref:DUF2061 domain-containing protein n=2 Tax=Flammeovirga TaxID=59739 RepID=A0A3Q9FNN9_9BACT|nr:MULTISPECIES: DUF2061 domain-containing protein [Flammeovirga]AZQ61832.1 DUF2061 domain-containing protein [Flammeovirga pectinis]MBB6460829.1 putative membrane protein [Flammeovirga kamogawensis]QWG08180.1 DUF2061 domain-containing protein [Flammeovirga kamogawensis]TRX69983.1 DUF2061 domain-containing protein [Flammeovirga kamogawensis]
MLADRIIEKKIQADEVAEQEAVKSGAAPKPRWVSIAKSVSWRIVGTIDTITISYLITGEVKMALSIGSFEVFSKMALYYFHERAWEKFSK